MKLWVRISVLLISFSFVASNPLNLIGKNLNPDSKYTDDYSQNILSGLNSDLSTSQFFPDLQSGSARDAMDDSVEDIQESWIPTHIVFLYPHQSTSLTCFFLMAPTKRHRSYFTGGVG